MHTFIYQLMWFSAHDAFSSWNTLTLYTVHTCTYPINKGLYEGLGYGVGPDSRFTMTSQFPIALLNPKFRVIWERKTLRKEARWRWWSPNFFQAQTACVAGHMQFHNCAHTQKYTNLSPCTYCLVDTVADLECLPRSLHLAMVDCTRSIHVCSYW